jgi:Zn-dependent protease with chaperone function
MAYVVGHELAHHYMGHLGSSCSGGGGGTLKPGDLVRVLRKVMPAINQASELQADIEGTKNMLDAGQSDPEYKWTEGGALLVIDFFKKLRDLHPGAVLFTFMSTHPAPELRAPIVKGTANAWRVTHPGSSAPPAGPADTTGAKLPIPLPPGMSLPLPMPSGLPMPPTPK